MQNDEIHNLEGDLRTEILRAAHELAAARMDLVIRRWGVDLKYSQTQPRVAAGQDGAGQWTDGPGGLTTRAKRARAARKAAKALARMMAANPEAAAMAARAVGLPVMAATVGVARSDGLTSVIASGGAGRIGGEGMTPILGIPFNLPVTASAGYDHLTPDEQNAVIDKCMPAYDGLAKICRTIKSPVRAKACWAHASDILAECIQDETENVRARRRR